ncbi:MAG: hypothetical protein ACO26G_04730 [Rickettsiales bacterium]
MLTSSPAGETYIIATTQPNASDEKPAIVVSQQPHVQFGDVPGVQITTSLKSSISFLPSNDFETNRDQLSTKEVLELLMGCPNSRVENLDQIKRKLVECGSKIDPNNPDSLQSQSKFFSDLSNLLDENSEIKPLLLLNFATNLDKINLEYERSLDLGTRLSCASCLAVSSIALVAFNLSVNPADSRNTFPVIGFNSLFGASFIFSAFSALYGLPSKELFSSNKHIKKFLGNIANSDFKVQGSNPDEFYFDEVTLIQYKSSFEKYNNKIIETLRDLRLDDLSRNDEQKLSKKIIAIPEIKDDYIEKFGGIPCKFRMISLLDYIALDQDEKSLFTGNTQDKTKIEISQNGLKKFIEELNKKNVKFIERISRVAGDVIEINKTPEEFLKDKMIDIDSINPRDFKNAFNLLLGYLDPKIKAKFDFVEPKPIDLEAQTSELMGLGVGLDNLVGNRLKLERFGDEIGKAQKLASSRPVASLTFEGQENSEISR